MKTFFLSLAGAFVALILFVLVCFIMLGSVVGAASAPTPQGDDLVLELDMRLPMTDQPALGGLAAISGELDFTTLLTRLEAAATDDNVKGVFIRASETSVGSSRAEELRQRIAALRASGKFVIAHSQGLYSNGGPSALRAVSAADEIWLQPGADVMSTGISLETEFLKGLFDKLSITPEIEAFYEYKNAPNSYTQTGYTEPHREALTALAERLWSISVRDIALDRGLDPAALRAALEAGPKSSEDMLALKLVDKLGWPEEAEEAAIERAGEGELIDVAMYTPPAPSGRADAIAVVGGEGGIITGPGVDDFFASEPSFFSDPVAEALLAAGRDEDVKAVVFRVESPGGSPTASDQVWRAVERVQEMGKPVVVSMGSVAASGGYYVSTGADFIMANETTITGSIGIFGGKFAIAEGLERIGVNIDEVSVGGTFADAYGSDKFTEDQRTVVRDWLKRGYDRFTGLVAEGRKMSVADVHERARGRVWSGADALDQKLVDGIGTYIDAIGKARELAGIEADAEVRLVYYPERKTGFEALEEFFGASGEAAQSAVLLGRIAADPRLNAAMEEYLAVNSGQARATMAPIRER